MSKPKGTDDEVMAAIGRTGSIAAAARLLGTTERSLHRRRQQIEAATGVLIPTWGNDLSERGKVSLPKIGVRQIAEVKSGHVVVFGDGHFWPGERSTAFDALIHIIKETQPKLIVANGDMFDGARISRHPPTEWAHQPTVRDEIDAVKERLAEVEAAAPRKTSLAWCMGNHDSRMSMRLAHVVPEFVGVEGFDLTDHFPAWDHSWSCLVNGDLKSPTMVKHRWKGGIYAERNNVKEAGISMVTGHLHKCQVYRWHDYSGTRWGVDGGCISDFGPEATKFTTYTEDNPLPWGSGFCILTYDAKGMLLPPELVHVVNDVAYFRGEAISVNGKKALKRK